MEYNVIPALFAGKTSADEVRIWVAGCATGEEAYSIAMLCAEHALDALDVPKVQIFATDIDESAIATAREGLYTLNDAADVSPERLRRFFTTDGNCYRVRREIREMILFANHNFLKDPPFSKLDLVTCRNVFIYLNSTAQERAVETFHFALKPKRFLFLGTSESVDGASDLYDLYNRDHHIFQAREANPRSYPIPDSVPTFLRSKLELLPKPDERRGRSQQISFGELHQQMLEQYAPPSVVVNEEYEIVHMTERAGKYFEFSGGEPTKNLLKVIRPEIRLELRSALFQAIQNASPVEAHNIKLVINGQLHSLDVHVRPVLEDGDTHRGYILVIFKPAQEALTDGATVTMSSDEPVARQLEGELISLKAQLRNSVEQHEYQSEELKASNEELQAMNEELRSAAEELETSKEELQSINEELRTVNQELKVKIDETSISSNNLQNLINSANVGTIFLDRSLSIRLFTPAVLEIFNLKSGDYGRPVTDITNKLNYDGLVHDAETVLEKLSVIEREVSTTDNRFFMMRLLPYRTSEDRINGVVITFFDITKRRESEEALRLSEERMRLLIESAKDYAIFTFDTQRRVVSWSTGAEMMMGYSGAEIIGKQADVLFTPEDREKHGPENEVENAEKNGMAKNERWHVRKDGHHFWGSGSVSLLRDNGGKVLGFVKIMRDLTEQRHFQEALRLSEEKYRVQLEKDVEERTTELKQNQELLQATLDSSLNMIQVFKAVRDERGKVIDFTWVLNNATAEKLYGKVDGESLLQKNPDVLGTGIFDHFAAVTETGIARQYEKHYTYGQFNGWIHQSVVKMDDGVATSTIDITDRKQAGEHLRKSEERLRMFVTASANLVYNMNADWSKMYALQSESFLSATHTPASGWMDSYIPADEQEKVQAAIDHAIANKEIFELEHRVILANGNIGWAYSRAIPLLDEQGEILEWFGVASDINARKFAEEERYKNYLLLRQSEDVAGTGSWDYDLLTGKFVWSDGMYRLFNLQKGIEVRPEIYIQYATAESRPTAERIAGHIKQGDAEFEETLTIDVEGVVKVLNIKSVGIKNEEGHLVRVLGVDVDVTATKAGGEKLRQLETEQQLEIFRVTLRTQEEERRRISENLHNGLGQLLYGIKISMNELTTAAAQQDSDAYTSSKRYTEDLLTDAIKESRRISHELMPMVLDEFGLTAAVKDICHQLQDDAKFNCRIQLKGIKLDKYFELAVYRTVQELMLNVVKHAKATICQVDIAVKDGKIMIRVEDNGNGMASSSTDSTGIGLASIRSKANLLNGNVNITSAPGKGTVVEVRLVIDARKN